MLKLSHREYFDTFMTSLHIKFFHNFFQLFITYNHRTKILSDAVNF